MAYQCFQCDKEVLAGGKFCHHCGAPTYAAEQALGVAARAGSEARERIKQDVHAAARIPHATLMLQTVLQPAPRPRPEPLVPPFWRRVAGAWIWRRWWFWLAVGVVLLVTTSVMVTEDILDKAAQQGSVQKIVTRVAARCFADSPQRIEGYVARIHAASGGADSLLDSATLFEYVLRGVTLTDGNCSKVADLLARPDRFERLFRDPAASSR